ncbi:cation diffusion facilitator family transporter [Arenimonas sp.]|uniref:cation diffusion facilitator family transporter n=1 Tax=Arenimonas sp. TaxID=1872635 RepID=UPI0035B1271B
MSPDVLARPGRAFAIGIGLNLAFVAIEAWYGWKSGSLALLADAAHNLSDVGGLLLAWGGMVAAGLKPDERHTYGWRRATILASFANAVILLVAMGSLAWEAIGRLGESTPVHGGTVIVVAAVGVVINFATAWLFLRGRDDLNIQGAFLHMLADGLVSVGVVVSGALMLWLGWDWLDPVVSLGIAAIVVGGTWSLFRKSLHLLFDGVPEGLSLPAIRASLEAVEGVAAVHHVHVWALGTSENALTAHLVLIPGADADAVLAQAHHELAHGHRIRHATLQLESATYADACAAREELG